ncbi:hypothetical protein [Mycolicibacterium thermoresistibile]
MLVENIALIAFPVVGSVTLAVSYIWCRRRIDHWNNPYAEPIMHVIQGIAAPVPRRPRRRRRVRRVRWRRR